MGPRVLIDAATLADPGAATRGFGRYVRALLDSLAELGSVSPSALSSPTTALPDGVPRVDLHRRVTGRFAFYEHVARLGIDVARAAPDVFHQPTAEPPLLCRRPWVQTLHDVIPLVFPDPAFAAERWRWKVRGRSMRRADAVIAITRFSADAGIRHLGLRADRIHVVLHGVNPVFTEDAPRSSPDRPYLLYVGEYGPHKGFGEAVEVVERIADAGHPHRLVMVGNVHPEVRSRVDGLLARSSRIDHVGRVSDDELARLYRGATALLFTSRCEGFGRPPIEAMATGTPVVAFANTSVPEVVADGGALVTDGDVDAFVREVRHLIDDAERWAELSDAGRRRAATFDWQRCAREHAAVYELVS